MVSTPLITPVGVLTGKTDNMESGRIVTNDDDSDFNCVAAKYVSMRMKKPLKLIEVQGDDAVFHFEGLKQNDLSTLSATYAELG